MCSSPSLASRIGKSIALTLLAGSLLSPAVAAPTWSSPKTLSSVPISNGSPVAAANNNGRVVVAYAEGTKIKLRIRDHGTSWTTAYRMASRPQVPTLLGAAVAPNGEVALAWIETSSAHQTLQTAFFAAGAWSAATVVSSAGFDARTARLAYDGLGNATLVWTEANPALPSCALRAATGSAASGFSSAQLLASDCYALLELAVNAKGEALAVRSGGQVIHGGFPVVAVSRSATGIWSAPFVVAGATYRSGQPAVALADNGLAMVVWLDAYGVNWSRRAADGTWTLPAPLDLTYSTIFAGPPRVAMDSIGNSAVLVPAFDASFVYTPLQAARLGARSNAWTSLATIGSPTASVTSYALAATPAGNYLAGWVDTTADPVSGIMAGAGVATASRTSAWTVTQFGGGDYSIAIAAGSGFAVAAWNEVYATTPGLRASVAALH